MLLDIELRWLGHLFGMPSGCRSVEVFLACTTVGGAPGANPEHVGEIIHPIWIEFIGILEESLEKDIYSP